MLKGGESKQEMTSDVISQSKLIIMGLVQAEYFGQTKKYKPLTYMDPRIREDDR